MKDIRTYGNGKITVDVDQMIDSVVEGKNPTTVLQEATAPMGPLSSSEKKALGTPEVGKVFNMDWDGPSKVIITDVDTKKHWVYVSRVVGGKASTKKTDQGLFNYK